MQSKRQKFTLPAGTTNRHQWHKDAAKAVEGVTRTFDMVREIWGTHGEEERENYVTHLSFGADDPKNPEAVAIYNQLGERFDWAITKDNAANIAEAFREALPRCMESIPVEDNRKTTAEIDERNAAQEQQAEERQAAAEEKSGKVEKLAEELRKQYPDAISADSGKSSHARAAANLKRILQAQGLRVSVKSSSFSMGNSVTARVLTPDLTPERRKEIDAICETFTYSTFDPMTDYSGYKHDDVGEAWELVHGRAKYCRAEYEQSDDCRAAIREFLGNDDQHSSQPHQIWSGAHCRAAEFWEQWAEEHKAPTPPAPSDSSYDIQQHTHTKKGFQFYIVVLRDRVERDEYLRLRASCKAAGGWYSRNFGKTPGGFAFKDRERAGAWAIQEFSGPDGVPPDTQPPPKPKQDTQQAEKLRNLAEKLTPQIEAKHGDRQTNTPKRQRQAMSARIDGDRLQRVQQALYALADLHDTGEVPQVLAKITTKKAVFDLLGTVTNSTGYYHIGDTGEHSKDTPEANALWKLLTPKSDEDKAAEALRDKVEALQFLKIPGYFATPYDLVADMLDHAQIGAGHSVLEPSAGSGAITDQLADLHADPLIVVNEINPTLCEILQAKGFDARPVDFMETNGAFQYDRVVMNPPFEKLQDIDHVCHAFGKLKDGGRLVSIMSPGPFFRDDQKCRTFRGWFEELGGEVHDIEAGAFKESGTGVASKLVIIDKPEVVRKATPQVEAIPGMTPLGVKPKPVQADLF